MWPITGICHHAQDCTKYQTQCHTCPLLYKGSKHDLSYQVFLKKQKLYKKANITFVACSQWLEELARHSVLALGHSVTNIPNPINTNLFRPLNKTQVRKNLNLPTDKKLLFVQLDENNRPEERYRLSGRSMQADPATAS